MKKLIMKFCYKCNKPTLHKILLIHQAKNKDQSIYKLQCKRCNHFFQRQHLEKDLSKPQPFSNEFSRDNKNEKKSIEK